MSLCSPTSPILKILAVDSIQARQTAEKHHYLHRKPQVEYAFGLFTTSEEIKGICTFGSPAQSTQLSVVGNIWQNRLWVIELNRLWVNDDQPKNTESWFVSRALKLLPAYIVVSYADTAYGHEGYIYRALNFHYAGTTQDTRNQLYDYVMPDQGNKHPRGVKWGTPGAIKVPRSIKNKYWITAGPTRTDRKRLEQMVHWPSLSWKEK